MMINKKKGKKLLSFFSILSLFFQTLSVFVSGFLFQPGIAFADDTNLCVVDADVVMVLDVSSSMNEGGSPSHCQWFELETVGTTQQCVEHNQDGLQSSECLAKPDVAQCDSPSFTESVPSKIESAKTAAKSFLDNLMSSDQSGLVTFSNTAQLAKQLSNDHLATKTAIDGATVFGSTNIGDAIGTASLELGSARANPQASKTMILLTDGKANKPNGDGTIENAQDVAYAEQKAQEAAALGYKIFTIGLGSGSEINETMLQNIANATGASYHHSPDGSFLQGIYQEISNEVCQYGSISGCKYSDANNNSTIDTGELKLSGWEISLSGAASMSQLTDADGCYTFAGLLAGNYTVSEAVNSGKEPFTQTYPTGNSYSVTLAKGANLVDYNFANYIPVCGNNIVDQAQNEQCDDGNTANGDGCSATCQTEQSQGAVCGNGAVETGEQCDDSNTVSGDGCSATCQTEQSQGAVCGNGAVETGEQCDDSNTVSGDGCSATCQTEQSGNGNGTITEGDIIINEIMENPEAVLDSVGEWFELYNTTNQNIDLSGCVIEDIPGSHIITSLIIPAHGYAILAESSDTNQNGGVTPQYVYSDIFLANSSDQIVLTCNQVLIDKVVYNGGFPLASGTSMILKSFSLDNNVGSNWCLSTTVFGAGDRGTPSALNDVCQGAGSVCGNGAVETGEQCDDSNTVSGDGCSATCQTEQSQGAVCGNGAVEAGEQCDDGNTTSSDGCSATCQTEQGGNGNGTINEGDIIINEIMENPSASDDAFGEWFEFYNTTNNSLDLSGCVIEDIPGSHTITSLIIPAQSYAILGISSNGTQNGGVVPQYVYSGITLSNFSDQIVLKCNSQLIDKVVYNGGFPLASGTSMILKSFSLDNNVGSNWCLSTTVFGAGDRGTPSALNDVCQGAGSVCGNGAVETGEQCDDSNTVSGDGCSATCQTEQNTPACTSGQQRVCATGQSGVCSNGNQTCSSDGTWGQCVAQSGPSTEVCNDSLDNDCDGLTDSADSNCTSQTTGGGGGPGGGSGGNLLFTINASAGINGTITPSGSVSVASGSNQTFTITPNSGFIIQDVLVDGISVGAVSTYTFSNITANHTISASFSLAGSGGGGDSGGGDLGAETPLTIYDEQNGDISDTIAIVTWYTNKPATTRVVFGTVPNPSPGSPTFYGYPFSTTEISEKTTYHIAIIMGLKPGVTYYWRPVSGASPEIFGKELSFTTEDFIATGVGGPLPPLPPEPRYIGLVEGQETVAIDQEDVDSTETVSPQDQPIISGAEETDTEDQNSFLAALPFLNDPSFWSNLCWILLIILIALVLYLIYKVLKKKNEE